tara:strand:- start:420 stop:716 length:297 start_codon:yes stop_codon:yes gene_type:complete
MDQNKASKEYSLKPFFIKLISIVISIIIILNVSYNLFLSERLEKIDKILLMDNDQFIEKLRKEINRAVEKDIIIPIEDKKLLLRLYKKIRKEFEDLEN